MSREPAPAFSVPSPTVTTGTCWSRRRRAATSGLTPLFEAKSEKIDHPGDPLVVLGLALLGLEHRGAELRSPGPRARARRSRRPWARSRLASNR